MPKEKLRSKNNRVLEIYNRLMQGEVLQKKWLAAQYQISEKSIQRDLEYLRRFFAKQDMELAYKRCGNYYILESTATNSAETADMIVQIGRILCEADTVEESERFRMVEWLLLQVPPKERGAIVQRIQAPTGDAEP